MSSRVRPNGAKRRLLAGLPVIAPTLGVNSIPDVDTLESLGSLGLFDVAWVEMEHGPWTWADLTNISRACDLAGITSMVRVNVNDPAVIGRTLDRGIQSVMVPHVNTKAEAERVVEGAYFAPLGKRGLWWSRQSYGVENYFDSANDEVMVVVMIEEIESIDNLPEILSVEGIDCFFVGPGDLGQTMGHEYLGKTLDENVQAVVREAVTTIVSAGRCAGTVVHESNVEQFLDLGARFLRLQTLPYLENGLRSFRERTTRAVTAADH